MSTLGYTESFLEAPRRPKGYRSNLLVFSSDEESGSESGNDSLDDASGGESSGPSLASGNTFRDDASNADSYSVVDSSSDGSSSGDSGDSGDDDSSADEHSDGSSSGDSGDSGDDDSSTDEHYRDAQDAFDFDLLKTLAIPAVEVEEVGLDATASVPGFVEGFCLKAHQIDARSWMRKRERDDRGFFGGILADDMGLGKTIQILVRIMDDKVHRMTSGQALRPTLVVTPKAIVDQWIGEVKQFTNLSVLEYQGASRPSDTNVLGQYDIVVTTYTCLLSEYGAYSQHEPIISKKFRKYATMEMSWLRVVLDEAHEIKNSTTKRALACCQLRTTYRWCVTGTPIQNTAADLFSFFHFLRIRPLSEAKFFMKYVTKPLKSNHGASRAMKMLQAVLGNVMLRRLKTDMGKEIELPSRHLHVVSCRFSADEQSYYDKLIAQTSYDLASLQGSSKYMGALTLLTRLRQACNHIDLAHRDKSDATPRSWNTSSGSTKIQQTLHILRDIRAASNSEDKTIIFSQFTTMLDALEPHLKDQDIRFCRYDGSMDDNERKHVLAQIKMDNAVTVILISLKAGGVGLNLTMCNHVISVDMWWNPALEEQAFDRVHRLGQLKEVHIYKLMIEGTVEDRIFKMQNGKRLLAAAALGGVNTSEVGMKLGDLLSILQPGRLVHSDDSDSDTASE